MKKAELLALIERMKAHGRFPLRSISQREELQLLDDAAFIPVHQYGEMVPLDGEIGTYRGVRLLARLPKWNP